MRSTVLPSIFATVAVVLAIGSEASQSSQGMVRRHHSKMAARAPESTTHTLEKRSFSGLATFYGMSSGDQGACGNYLNENDFTVALNEVQYGDLNSVSSYCEKTITITNGVKTTQAKITDACPTGVQCHYGALDMSISLFEYFNDKSVGVFDITWWISGSGDDSGSSSSSSSKSSSSKKHSSSSASSAASSSSAQAQEEIVSKSKAAAASASAKAEKVAAEKKKKAAAAKKAAAEKKKKAEAKAKKVAAEKKKKAEEKAAKVKSAQQENIAAFGEIMQTLNNMVEDALDTGSSSAPTPASSAASSSASDSATSTVTVAAATESASTVSTTSTATTA